MNWKKHINAMFEVHLLRLNIYQTCNDLTNNRSVKIIIIIIQNNLLHIVLELGSLSNQFRSLYRC